MNIIENGIKKGSTLYFHTPSVNARETLYYPIAAGEYYCDSKYRVSRESYNSFLALYVLDGAICFEQDDINVTIHANELLLADCYRPHTYYCPSHAHTLWVHFDGMHSKDWCQNLLRQKGAKMVCNLEVANHLSNIVHHLALSHHEYDLSKELYGLLCELSKPDLLNTAHSKYEQMQTAKEFILAHYTSPITVEEIAASVNLSPSYFTKLFKEATSFSPYDYLLHVRLEKAKELLCQTELSISDIAYRTGFHSDANFIYCFKKEISISPLQFRKLSF